MKISKIIKNLKEIKKLKMNEEWFSKNKLALLEFMEKHPVREVIVYRHKFLERLNILKLTLKPMPIIIGALIAALLAGSGTVYAAQASLPGDTLYPVKLMTENARTALAFTPEKKADLEAKFANRRLEEIQRLQEKFQKRKKEISAEVVEKAFERAEKKLEKAQEIIAKMEEDPKKEKALEVASRLEEALAKHQQILSDLAEQVPPEAQPALLRAQEKSGKGAERALEVILRLEKNKEVRERLKEKRIEGAEERARGKLKALENRLNALEKLVKNLEEQGRDVSQAKANISKIKNKLAEVENLIEQKKYLEAFSTSHEIMRLLMETNLLVRPLRQQERESKILPMLPGQPAPLQEAAPEKTEPTETEITPSPESLPINVLPVQEP